MERVPLDTTKLAADRRAFGEKLQGLRTARGVSLQSLAQETRIRLPILEGLEAGNFEKLPGEIYVRGFVRSLAKCLETDGEVLVAALSVCWSPVLATETDPIDAATAQAAAAAIASASAAASKEKKRPRTPPAGATSSPGGSESTGGVEGAATAASSGGGRTESTLAGVYKMMAALVVIGAVGLGARWAWDRHPQAGAARTPEAPTTDVAAPSSLTQEVAAQPVAAVEDDPVEAARLAAMAAAGDVTAAMPLAPTEAVPEAVRETVLEAMPETVEAAQLAQPAPKAEAELAPPPAVVAVAEAPLVPMEALVPSPSEPLAAPALPPVVEGRLEIVATEATRVRLALDAATSTERALSADTHVFVFRDKADLLVLDAGAVAVSFNGRPLGPLGASGRVRRLSFRTGAPEAPPPPPTGKSSLSARDPAAAKDQKM